MDIQRYALNIGGTKGEEWVILEAPIPCDAGQGKVIASGLSEDEMTKILNQEGSGLTSEPLLPKD